MVEPYGSKLISKFSKIPEFVQLYLKTRLLRKLGESIQRSRKVFIVLPSHLHVTFVLLLSRIFLCILSSLKYTIRCGIISGLFTLCNNRFSQAFVSETLQYVWLDLLIKKLLSTQCVPDHSIR